METAFEIPVGGVLWGGEGGVFGVFGREGFTNGEECERDCGKVGSEGMVSGRGARDGGVAGLDFEHWGQAGEEKMGNARVEGVQEGTFGVGGGGLERGNELLGQAGAQGGKEDVKRTRVGGRED